LKSLSEFVKPVGELVVYHDGEDGNEAIVSFIIAVDESHGRD